MKKVKIRPQFLLILTFICLSCEDYLDETPRGVIIPESIDDFGMMLDDATSPYDNYIAYGASNVSTMDDDLKIGNNRESKLYRYELEAYKWSDQLYTITQSDYDYTQFYKVIYLCNYILENIENAPTGNGTFNRQVVKGRALFNRANAYLNLVNLYAKHYDPSTSEQDLGVALPLNADPNQRLSRSSVQVVYDQILKDALEIEENNYLTNEVEYSFRASITAVYALLMRTYLYMGNFEKSYEYASKARNSLNSPLFDYNNLYLNGNNPDNGIEGGWPYSTYDLYECPDVICFKYTDYTTNYYYNLSEDLISIFNQESDLRFKIFITKYEWYDDYYEDEHGYRPSLMYDYNRGYGKGEVYITEAETALRLNKVQVALDRLNEIRKVRIAEDYYEKIEETNPEKLMKIILDERRRELMFKGLRFFDLKRLNKEPNWQKTITHELSEGTYTLYPNDLKYILPIPESVIQTNPSIKQNER